ncbi:MAG TPA: OmpA family protein [Vicinamibacterales bacterium]|nr:OmpA family protein [Vicinamibacterales bacterium]
MRCSPVLLMVLTASVSASAQTRTQTPLPSVPSAAEASSGVRPATTTFLGDTGLWNVPTAEILPARRWSLSAYRVNFDDNQGFSDVSNWPITFGYGIRDRAEIFGSFVAVNRIDRDIRPLFLASAAFAQAGGVVPQNPLARAGWSGNNVGDFWVGAKFNLASEWRQKPAAFAMRAMLKIPTGDKDSGAGTGRADIAVDAIASRELNRRAEVSGYGGFIVRGKPDAVETTNGFRWGLGAGFPSRQALRLTVELDGEAYTKSSLVSKTVLSGEDGSFLPVGFSSDTKSPVNLDVGLTWQRGGGFFAGAGWTWRVNMDKRDRFLSPLTNGAGDKMDIVGRIGYHPGVRVYAPPPTPPAPPPAAVAQNHPPTVHARCEPCTVFLGKISAVTADGQDQDGDALTYLWSAAAGTLTNASSRQTSWTAPMQEGPVPVSVRVDDGKGGTASDVVTIQVIKEALKEVTFEDVHFDFDRYSLRPEATRVLDEAVKALQDNPGLRIEIEGHTCNIGTAEYNLALGGRRANAVQQYLTSQGIVADRLHTVSYGEERPKYDNAREETRRLNRRAALVVRITR